MTLVLYRHLQVFSTKTPSHRETPREIPFSSCMLVASLVETFRSFFFSFREKFSFLRKRNQRLFFLILIVDVLVAHRRPVQGWLEMERFAAKFTFSISENFRYLLDMCIFNNLVKRNFFFTRQIPRNIFILRSTNSFKNFSFLLLLFFLIHRFD